MTYTDVDALFRHLRKKTGIRVTPHVLRHTGLTELFRAGMRPEVIQRRAGHAHAHTTIQVYVHPSEVDIRRDWEQAEARRKQESERRCHR
jgi:integrase